MIDEQRLRTILHIEANRHVVKPFPGTSTIAKARLSRASHVAGAITIVATMVVAGVGAVGRLARGPAEIRPAAGAALSANTVASGVTPEGSTWTLTSGSASDWSTETAKGFADQEGHCFGLTAGREDGRSDTCHAVPDDIDTWLHLESARLVNGAGDTAGSALYGEVSKRVTAIKITLRSGEVISPDVIEAPNMPYAYFVAFLDSQARGKVAAYDGEGEVVDDSRFTLDGGMPTE